MQADDTDNTVIEPEAREFYCRTLRTLNDAQLPYLVGGAYAFGCYTGIARDTKDLDIFVRQADFERVMGTLAAAGYQTELTFSHWLGKAYSGDNFVDVIFRSGNGVSEVDDTWFDHSVADKVLGIPVQICAAEDMLWTKAFIMERERFDGADVAHLLRARAETLDWPYLLRIFDQHWRVLLSQLILFGFIYPGERTKIPAEVIEALLARLPDELRTPSRQTKLCQGSILSREQYLPDLQAWGYVDGRVEPRGNMTEEQVEEWTEAIGDEE